MTVRALSFDVDGTLYEVRRLRVAWRLRWERGLLLALLAAREKMRFEPPHPSLERLMEREAELVAPSFGLSIDEARERLAELRAAMPAALTRGAKPRRGVEAALMAAHRRGIELAVLSDYDPEEKLSHLGLDRLPWKVKLSADGLGALKPNPRPFLELARAIECPPGAIVHIGDREDLDVAGALGAGLRAWRIAAKRGVATRAERVFSTYTVDLFADLRP
jgi:HAD superfamily hydrolase (TIGR01549 family)